MDKIRHDSICRTHVRLPAAVAIADVTADEDGVDWQERERTPSAAGGTEVCADVIAVDSVYECG